MERTDTDRRTNGRTEGGNLKNILNQTKASSNKFYHNCLLKIQIFQSFTC